MLCVGLPLFFSKVLVHVLAARSKEMERKCVYVCRHACVCLCVCAGMHVCVSVCVRAHVGVWEGYACSYTVVFNCVKQGDSILFRVVNYLH